MKSAQSMNLQSSAVITFTVKNVSQSLRPEFSSCRVVDAESRLAAAADGIHGEWQE
jgi:hypothetical protein